MVDGAAVDTEATAAVLDADPDTANFSLDRGSSPSRGIILGCPQGLLIGIISICNHNDLIYKC